MDDDDAKTLRELAELVLAEHEEAARREPMPTIIVDFPKSHRIRHNSFKRDGLHIDYEARRIKGLDREEMDEVDDDHPVNLFVDILPRRATNSPPQMRLDAVTTMERVLRSPYWLLPRSVLAYRYACERNGIKLYTPFKMWGHEDEWILPIKAPLDAWQRAARKNCNRPRRGPLIKKMGYKPRPRGDKVLVWPDGEAKWNVLALGAFK